ncbi:NAD(P)-dependent oxidoreductase [Kocuria massiliensis]|uniref:NAD(P)-dependent oxidoreductase n=1 Tax=Kocuria massiliensis TaxID=1926282 RepID=UPI0022B940B9|nr:NAD(P)H-binding protein [Kocuria massiliensis]
MKFLVIGATGRTGRLFTAQALNEGHELTALVRRPDADVDPRIRLVTGSVTDPVAIAEASQDVDAIVSTLGVKSIKEAPTLMTDTIRAIIESTKTSGIRRVVIVSAFGVGDSLSKSSRIASLLFRTMLKKKYADKAASEVLLRATDLDWTLEYPGALNNGTKPSYKAVALDDVTKLPFVPSTSRTNVARFLLHTAVEGTYVRKVAVVTDAK